MSAAAAPVPPDDAGLRRLWEAAWEEALAAWSRFTKLTPPRLCFTAADEKREGLAGSFAMIRLEDQAVVVSLRQVRELGLERFPREVLAHEVGHHVYAPADARDNARLLARLRRALPTREGLAGLVANLYTDLLVNDRLARAGSLDMAGVYRALRPRERADRLWTLYLRVYEALWRLPAGTLVEGDDDARLRSDAELGARVVRAYAREWLRGAGRFGTLLLPYLLEMKKDTVLAGRRLLDACECGAGGEVPDGLVEVEEDELEGAIHPAEDPELTGLDAEEPEREEADAGRGRAEAGGRKERWRDPAEYVDLLKSVGVRVPERELVARYYRELALPHLVPFPVRVERPQAEPQPEGLVPWDTGSPLHRIDWTGTLAASPVVVPGVTTLEREEGTSEGHEPRRTPVDLYVGIDCSGSMANPARALSYPVLAGAVVALSALRAGARVMACLSGEPGEHSETTGFTRDEAEVLRVLTGYLGTGYSFGTTRLRATFVDGEAPLRPTHVLVVSDSDWVRALAGERAWEVARQAAERAKGGATAVLQLDPGQLRPGVARVEAAGFRVHPVASLEELVAFARAFSRAAYGRGPGARA